jgi:hypothetical protein
VEKGAEESAQPRITAAGYRHQESIRIIQAELKRFAAAKLNGSTYEYDRVNQDLRDVGQLSRGETLKKTLLACHWPRLDTALNYSRTATGVNRVINASMAAMAHTPGLLNISFSANALAETTDRAYPGHSEVEYMRLEKETIGDFVSYFADHERAQDAFSRKMRQDYANDYHKYPLHAAFQAYFEAGVKPHFERYRGQRPATLPAIKEGEEDAEDGDGGNADDEKDTASIVVGNDTYEDLVSGDFHPNRRAHWKVLYEFLEGITNKHTQKAPVRSNGNDPKE